MIASEHTSTLARLDKEHELWSMKFDRQRPSLMLPAANQLKFFGDGGGVGGGEYSHVHKFKSHSRAMSLAHGAKLRRLTPNPPAPLD